MRELFSPGFLIPLEGTDTQFHLEVKHLNLRRYVGMLKSGEFHDDLDIVTEVHSTSGDVTVKRPETDIDIFNPGRVIHSTAFVTKRGRLWPWKPQVKAASFDKLQIPLPIPHPASIAISIYNREHDQNPIDYDDYYCQRIIRATKEVPYAGDPVSNDLCEIELTENTIENDTPEKTTDNSNPLLHIAQQERSFSDENMAASTVSGSQVDVIVHSTPTVESSNDMPDEHEVLFVSQGEGDTRERVCFAEPERDTSCAIDIPDADTED